MSEGEIPYSAESSEQAGHLRVVWPEEMADVARADKPALPPHELKWLREQDILHQHFLGRFLKRGYNATFEFDSQYDRLVLNCTICPDEGGSEEIFSLEMMTPDGKDPDVQPMIHKMNALLHDWLQNRPVVHQTVRTGIRLKSLMLPKQPR